MCKTNSTPCPTVVKRSFYQKTIYTDTFFVVTVCVSFKILVCTKEIMVYDA